MTNKLLNYIFKYLKSKLLHVSIEEINIENYRKSGIKIGERCVFGSTLPTGIDAVFLSFGDDCLVSSGVRFLMHDAAPTVVSDSYTDIIGGGVSRK